MGGRSGIDFYTRSSREDIVRMRMFVVHHVLHIDSTTKLRRAMAKKSVLVEFGSHSRVVSFFRKGQSQESRRDKFSGCF